MTEPTIEEQAAEFIATIDRLRADATAHLAEIQGHGCEAESARAFEKGRLSALDELDWRQQPS